tara:strand:- start:9675 stop:10319 length:645 start_codon:yes stop_codon:yes gene_type:complete
MHNPKELSDDFEGIQQTNVYGLFMSPVGNFTNKNHDRDKKLITDFINQCSKEDLFQSPNSDICHGVTQIGQNNVLDHPLLKEVKQSILTAVNEVNDNALKYDLSSMELIDSHIEVASQSSIYAPHEFSNCLYSGCYFINYDAEKHAPLKFKRTTQSTFYPIMQCKQTGLTPFNLLDASVPTVEGDIIIFPSNLTHGYETNGEHNRITLTFNVSP